MKKQILFISFLVFISQFSFSQYGSNNISSYDIKIVQQSINIYYSNNTFKDYYRPYYSPGNALAAMQAKFDYNFNLVNSAYSKVLYQEFLNPGNKSKLSAWKKKVEAQARKVSNVNWGRQSSYALKLRAYFLDIYNKESVKNELLLLQEINKEMNRLKRTFPGRFHKTDRYNELLLALKALKTCKSYEISDISYKFGLF
ncbi:MAG: hypothetical protein ACPH3L_09055 [Flavobacteriaceae bacterium]